MSGDQKGMLFQRSIPVPEGVGVELLLQKWNPGMPDYAIEDLLVSVLRWNGLSSFSELQPNQEILIPTVVPPGLTPRQWRESQKDRPRRQPFSIAGAKFEQATAPEKPANVPMSPGPGPAARVLAPRPGPPAAARPAAAGSRFASPTVHSGATTASLLEMKLRQTAQSPGPWQASNRPGQAPLAGSEVKEQFQRQMQEMIWKKRAMNRPF